MKQPVERRGRDAQLDPDDGAPLGTDPLRQLLLREVGPQAGVPDAPADVEALLGEPFGALVGGRLVHSHTLR